VEKIANLAYGTSQTVTEIMQAEREKVTFSLN
jgi:hypothetical protein